MSRLAQPGGGVGRRAGGGYFGRFALVLQPFCSTIPQPIDIIGLQGLFA